ncbi:MAG: GatB/YqeY domain-containing protein, partial [Deltaproteobacteria bacterium]|nr:GatB/YqeY domain-containing protein [Deltaproteobacteria bacterium]
EMLELYLPQMASEQEVEAWIGENIDLTGYKNPMQAMGSVMKHFGKLADGNLVKRILQKKG